MWSVLRGGGSVGGIIFLVVSGVGGAFDVITRPEQGHGFGAYFDRIVGVGWPALALACGFLGAAMSSGFRLWRSERGGDVGHILDELEGMTFRYGAIFECDGLEIIGGASDFIMRDRTAGEIGTEIVQNGVYDAIFPEGGAGGNRPIQRITQDEVNSFRDQIETLCTRLEKHNAFQPRKRDREGYTFDPCVLTDRGRDVLIGAEARIKKRGRRLMVR